MDDYSTKIKLSAEHSIRVVFPEKALELDTLVSACISSLTILKLICFQYFSKSPVLSFSEVTKVRAEILLPTVNDIIAYSNNAASSDVSFIFLI